MHEDRSDPEINGRAVDYNPKTAYASRYVKSEWDSGVIHIAAGGLRRTLNFMKD
jgi:hypothetical protein